jgi:D-lactate dehydrogenase (cytochrome)
LTNDQRLPTSDWQAYLEDAAHFPGGHAAGIVFPRTLDDVVEAVLSSRALLPIGAQSSLTGGATPMGETILSTSRMNRIVEVARDRITVEPGVSVAAMQDALAAVDAWFPPAPTFTGATAGGIVATNAAGAATFKYGSTRTWVEAVTIVLADGTVLDVARGRQQATGGRFVLETRAGQRVVPVPTYRMPAVAKRSAGYHAEPGMDLIDLFIGSEGTLGVVARVTFRAASPAPAMALALVPCPTERAGIELVSRLRAASLATRRDRDERGIDVAAIEHMDGRSIRILEEDGVDRRHNLAFPPATAMALLIQLELHPGTRPDTVRREVEDALTSDPPDSSIVRFCRLLDDAGLLAVTELALPGQARRVQDFLAAREAVPVGVNQRVGAARRARDARIEKTAADMIVPFERFAEMMDVYRAGFESRGLDYAVWGHISDGNVHPNVIPRTFDDVVKGKEAILEFGREVVRFGGCPLAEHGVGRSPVKQTLLRQLYGDAGVEEMRAVKRALDPGCRLAPGVLFAVGDRPGSARQRSRPT